MIYLLLIVVTSVVALGVVIYKWLRPKFPIKVECWFCGKFTVVPYGNRECWDCPGCDQYNGFREDGHYNKPIPAQYCESMNYPISSVSEDFISKDTVLCDECNQNQLLKVRQLAAFVPLNENNFDAEVEAFEHHLERVYKLCDSCQGAVNLELDKQDNVLYAKLDQVSAELSMSSERSNEKDSAKSKLTLPVKPLGVTLAAIAASLSSVCALILGIAQLHIHQHQLHMTWLPTSYLTPIIHPVIPKLDVVAGLGLMMCFLSKLFLGKNRLFVLDAINIPIWMLTLLVDGQYGQMMFGQYLVPAASCIHHILNTATSVVCVVANRTCRTAPTISMKRLSLDSSKSSQGSADTLTEDSPIRSVSEANYSEDSSQTVGQFNKLDDTLSDLGAFSIGTACTKQSRSGIFSCSSFTSGQPVSVTGFSFGQALHNTQNRPLISPAKLQVTFSQNKAWSGTHYKPDNPFLQVNRETSMFQGTDPSTTQLSKPLGDNFDRLSNQSPSNKMFSLKQSAFNDFSPFKTDTSVIANDRGSVISGRFSTRGVKSSFTDTGSVNSGRFSNCDKSQKWNVRNHPINKLEDFQDWDSKSTESSLCPVDSTTRSDVRPAAAFWKSSGFVGFVLGASFVVNVFLAYNSWQRT